MKTKYRKIVPLIEKEKTKLKNYGKGYATYPSS